MRSREPSRQICCALYRMKSVKDLQIGFDSFVSELISAAFGKDLMATPERPWY